MHTKTTKNPDRCPKCNSTQIKIVEYTGNLKYMGKWIHCKYCGFHTQISVCGVE